MPHLIRGQRQSCRSHHQSVSHLTHTLVPPGHLLCSTNSACIWPSKFQGPLQFWWYSGPFRKNKCPFSTYFASIYWKYFCSILIKRKRKVWGHLQEHCYNTQTNLWCIQCGQSPPHSSCILTQCSTDKVVWAVLADVTYSYFQMKDAGFS